MKKSTVRTLIVCNKTHLAARAIDCESAFLDPISDSDGFNKREMRSPKIASSLSVLVFGGVCLMECPTKTSRV